MRKFLALIIITILLTLPVSAGEGSFSVVYLPADDRPLSDQQMRLFANSLGVELIMPERSLYARNGSDDRGELLCWLEEQEGDYYIIALDTLLSGGLIESRTLTGQSPVTLPTGEMLTEEEVIEKLLEITAGKQCCFLDSLLRLACNVVTEQDLPAYDATLRYGRGEVHGPLPEYYLAARQRKLRLNLYAAENLPGYLLGVDDSWAGETIQREELARLREYVPPEQIFSTFDALPRLALAKLCLQETGIVPRVTVRYFGDETLVPAHNFESAEEMTEKALRYFGAMAGNDLEILILTEVEQGENVIRAVRENQKKYVPTILINLCPRDEEFEKAFLTIAPGQLLAYAGYGSSVNATHLGLSMGLARYACLRAGTGDAHLLFFATLLSDEFGYAAIGEEVKEKAEALGLDIYDFRRDFSELEAFTAENMAKKTGPVFRALMEGGILTGVSPYTVSSCPEIAFSGGYFPWHRCFEYHAVLTLP